jgi:ABC-type sugar transport system substrate-binding protein
MRARVLSLLAVAVLVAAACSSSNPTAAPGSSKTIKIGMANLTLCCAYFIGMSNAVQDEAKNYSNVQVLVTDGGGDVAKLTSDIEDLISKKVDGIIISGGPIESAPAALAALKAANIPIVMVDRKLKGGDYTSWIGPDNYAIGQEVGDFLKTKLNNTGKVAVIRGGPADNSIGSDRTSGLHSKLDGTGITIVTYSDWGSWSTDGGKKAMEDLLAKNSDLSAVFCENDSMCLGAQSAITDAGKTSSIVVAAVDGQKEALKAILDGTNYVATGRNDADQIGRAGLNRLMGILAGGVVPHDTVLPSPLITKDNAVKFYDANSTF